MAGVILYGRNPVLEALKQGSRQIEEVLLLPEPRGRLRELEGLARRLGLKVSHRSRAELTTIAGHPHHQGVVARVAAKAYADLDELLAIPGQRGEVPLFLALDQVQDPQNLGNLLRTAEGAGVHGVILLRHHAAGLTASAAKAAAGALEYLPVARTHNLVSALERLKTEGCWVVGATPDGAVEVWTADLARPLTLVLGGEGRGLRPLVARACDLMVRIPLRGRVGSLNVGAAGAILLYEVVRQRLGRAKKTLDEL